MGGNLKLVNVHLRGFKLYRKVIDVEGILEEECKMRRIFTVQFRREGLPRNQDPEEQLHDWSRKMQIERDQHRKAQVKIELLKLELNLRTLEELCEEA